MPLPTVAGFLSSGRTIQSCGGNKTKAAMELGISLRALYRKLEKYAGAPSPSSN